MLSVEAARRRVRSSKEKRMSNEPGRSNRWRKGFSIVAAAAIFGLSGLPTAQTASAKAVTIENYMKRQNAFQNFHASWLDGVFNGLKGANAELKRAGKEQLFCAPTDFSMTAQQVNAFFGTYIAAHKAKVATSETIGALLLEALKEAYPCSR
jgi:Rap1a immunity proteins